ncbi:RNA 2',3'-cyclic phosphodiesterase [Oceanobacillus manasiensis]|uniref:RNA 2',3'-cyclic phosphodiesterase n=1 Tax=Oceanobacillus manasiensis TaxID=586413 RepID=UPI0005A7B4F4|nr:RNA 2',3'-cyclic phosphodiesterase [Oceanobacillus manasiensis]
MGNHYFIAVPLPNSIKGELAKLQESLKQELTYRQWPYPEDFHITLKFYGDLPDNKVQELKDTLQRIQNLEAFSIEVGGVGYFGNPSKPRVLWTGARKTNELQTLYTRVEEISKECGIANENRPYRPHITIAKNWLGEAKKEQVNNLAKIKNEEKILTVDKIVLYQIFPQQQPKYHPVASFELKGDGDTGSVN